MRTYDPTKVSMVFAGNIVDGYGTDTFIKVARNNDGWNLKIGNSVTGARARNPDQSGTFEFTLLNSSPANAVLTAIANRDELSGTGVGEVLITDRTTASALCKARNAWIKKLPDWERAKELGETTWVLESENVGIAHDGNIDA